jgi:hypothetical protein
MAIYQQDPKQALVFSASSLPMSAQMPSALLNQKMAQTPSARAGAA